MLLARNMVGELLNRRVEKLNGEQNQNDADHGDIPDGAWRQHETQQHGDDKKDGFFTQGGFGFEAVDKTA